MRLYSLLKIDLGAADDSLHQLFQPSQSMTVLCMSPSCRTFFFALRIIVMLNLNMFLFFVGETKITLLSNVNYRSVVLHSSAKYCKGGRSECVGHMDHLLDRDNCLVTCNLMRSSFRYAKRKAPKLQLMNGRTRRVCCGELVDAVTLPCTT